MDTKKIMCVLFGHKKSVPMIIEDNDHLFIRGCPRCNAPIGLSKLWKSCPPPPASTPEDIVAFKKFIENMAISWRKQVAKEQRLLSKNSLKRL